ncbi:MAG: alanine--glyoxylate aminotransferase family protein [Thermoanaerobaculia bacterium]
MTEAIRYFVPGPVWVRDEVRAAMTRPVVGHRSPEFRAVYDAISAALPPIFRTARPVLTATASSTFVMEAALVSLTRRDLLHLVCGSFSERWVTIARALGRESDVISVPWGRAIDPDLVRQALARKRYEAVLVTHNETSTGVMNPLAEIARAVRDASDALVLVDAVSSLAGAPVETDAWGLDVVLAGVQKGIAAPPGVTAFTFSERAEERAAGIAHRGFYTDFLRYLARHRAGGPITTPAVPVYFALARQLERVLAEGIEARWDRHRRLLDRTAQWSARVGARFASAPDARSWTVSCLEPPAGCRAPELVARAAARGFTLGGGYGEWKQSTYRIGHMGEVRESDLAALLQVLEEEASS